MQKQAPGDDAFVIRLRTCASLALLAGTLASATPTMRLGARFTIAGDIVSNSWYDSLGETVVITTKDRYRGVGLEAVYGPVGWFYGRMDLAELRFFNAGGGALAVFPSVGLDVLAEPPFRWRLMPYVWGGMRWTGYWGSQGTPDPRFYGMPDYELRAGLGLRYALNRRLHVFAETKVLGDFTWLTYAPFRDYPSGYSRLTTVGFLPASLGVRYDFGGK